MDKVVRKIISKDGSMNFIIPYAKSFIEARYVRRTPHYVSAYVSSHNGCKMGCKFCWLTTQNQTQFKHVGLNEYILQLKTILDNVPTPVAENEKANKIRINVNFMGRGDALANKTVLLNYPDLYESMLETVTNAGFGDLKMNVSSILPYTIKQKNLFDIFLDYPVHLYYSLYSVNDAIKRQLMPNAIDWRLALDKLAKFQQTTLGENSLVFHGAFIKNVNDSQQDIENLVSEISKRNFKNTKFNLVRFNPPIGSNLQETSEDRLKEIFTFLSSHMNDNNLNKKSTLIERVGYDAYVSCGMFPQDDQIHEL